jgi:hypothetical protein
MEAKRNAYRILVGKQKERNQYQDLDVDGKIKIKWVLER